MMLVLASSLILFIISLLAFSRSRYARWAVITVATSAFVYVVLTAAWIASDSFTGEGFNSAVVYHLRTGPEGAGMWEYIGMLAATLVLGGVALLLALILLRRLLPGSKPTNSVSALLSTVAILGLCLLHPTVNGFLSGFNAALYGPDSVLSALWDSEGDRRGAEFSSYFVEPAPSVDARPALNLVVLYAESLEQTYFDEELFPGLITELRELEDEAIRFSDIRNLEGTGFTIAGMVASQCGLPLITNGHPNSMRGMDQFLPGANCIGDILKERDYALHYMGGADLSFAGKGKFFESHGFDSISGRQELAPLLDDPDYVSTWGLYDDFLLNQFFNRYTALASAGHPFGLFALTMDTHHPRGHRSRSCDDLEYGDGSNRMLNAVKCADRLLANTIRKIRNSPWSDNTLLVVASDHTALKNDAWDLLVQGRRRNLLWFFPPDGMPREINKPGTTLDTAAAIMHFLEAPIAEFALGRSLIGGGTSAVESLPRINWQMREWRGEFAAFWQLPDAFERLQLDADRMLVTIDERNFQAPALLTFADGEVDSIRFAFDSLTDLHRYVRQSLPDATLVWFDECISVRSMDLTLPNKGMCVFAGEPASDRFIAESVQAGFTLLSADLKRLHRGNRTGKLFTARMASLDSLARHGAADVREHTIELDDLPAPGVMSVHSSGGPGSRSFVKQDDNFERLDRGLHLFRITADDSLELLASIDPCAGETNVALSEILAEQEVVALAYLVVAHDSATCGQPLDRVFADTTLRQWQTLGLRQPYVALVDGSEPEKVVELVGNAYTSLRVTFNSSAQIADLGVSR